MSYFSFEVKILLQNQVTQQPSELDCFAPPYSVAHQGPRVHNLVAGLNWLHANQKASWLASSVFPANARNPPAALRTSTPPNRTASPARNAS